MTDSTGRNFYLVTFSKKPDVIYVLGKYGWNYLLNKHKMNHSENILLKIDGKPDGREFDIIDSTTPPPPPPPPGGGALIRMVEIPVSTIVNSNELSGIAAIVARLLNTHDANTPVPQETTDEIDTLLQKYLNEDKKGGKKIGLRRRSSSSRRRRSTQRRTASLKQQKRRRGSRRAH